MITPEEFVARWKGEPLIRANAEAVRTLKISDGDKRFLREAGLPRSIDDFKFDIEGAEIPYLETKRGHWQDRFRLIGSLGANDVGLDEEAGGSVVAVDDFTRSIFFINSSMPQLAESLLTLLRGHEMVDEESLDIMQEGDKKRLLYWLRGEFERIDAKSLESESDYWHVLLYELEHSS